MTFLKSMIFGLLLLSQVVVSPAYASDRLNILRDEETERYLKTMTRQIFESAGLSPEAVKFVLVDSPELNAFVAGGQNIFLNTGLILETGEPSELIGVIAHETGHIAGGHLFRGQAEMSNLSLQAILANILGVVVAIGVHAPDAGVAIGNVGNAIAMRSFLRHTRTQEGSADQAGVRFLQDSGLSTAGFLTFMKRLSSQELLPESQQSEYVRTHPLTQDRIDFLQHVVDTQKQGTAPSEWVDLHRRMKAKLLGYLFPDRALLEKSDAVWAQYGRAIAWFRQGRLDKALPAIDGLLKAEPKNPYFYELKGQLMFENGRLEEAITAYAEAADLAPFSGLIRIAYAQSLLEAKDNKTARQKEAIRQLTLALEKERKISEPHHLLAIAYGKQGQEGLSRLHLAEEALMQNKLDFARREAALARAHLKKGTPSYQRAADILDAADKADKNRKEKD